MSAQDRKKIVKKIFGFIMQGRPKDGLPYFSSNCKQHNPYVKGGMDALFDSMAAVQKETPKFSDPFFSIKKIMADGNMVAVHTELLWSKSKPREGGLRQAHLFKFGKGNKVVEYWDITQMVDSKMPNPEGVFS